MSICDEIMYTCGATSNAVTSLSIVHTINQTRDRVFTLTCGDKQIVLNKRTRDYTYRDEVDTERNNFRYVYSIEEQNARFECFTEKTTVAAAMNEHYEAVDSTILFADLRNDCVVYKEATYVMDFESVSDVRVSVRTTWGDALLFPFIEEVVPITRTTRYKCTLFDAPLHEATVAAGYWDGMRALMPSFTSGAPYGSFTLDGDTYDAAVVDWYYIPSHRAADGDEFLYWADWHKSVGEHNEIDALEAQTMWQLLITAVSNPYVVSSANGLYTDSFAGSVARDAGGNVFMSAVFDPVSQKIKVNKLLVQGQEKSIPTDCECDVWFPIAPL